MASSVKDLNAHLVALRKESVDRNRASEITGGSRLGRSPQGERG